jgi:hypothetical protein
MITPEIGQVWLDLVGYSREEPAAGAAQAGLVSLLLKLVAWALLAHPLLGAPRSAQAGDCSRRLAD